MSSTPRIELRKLTKIFRSGGADLPVLTRVDLRIAAEESVAILGPSGSGKSTLLALVAGLDRPTSGEIFVDGQSIATLSESKLALLRRHKIGFVFQSFQLLPNMTALENVQLPLELLADAQPRDGASELLELVGLADRAHHYPTQLSGGEQQRVALARAFAPSPAILLADEPTGNLDRRTGSTVLELIASLRERFGTTLVLVTHDSAAAQLADRRLALEDGHLVPATSQTDGLLAPSG
jgi:putative ABC transport system ATP-binding protein